jgi:hypothetical protein
MDFGSSAFESAVGYGAGHRLDHDRDSDDEEVQNDSYDSYDDFHQADSDDVQVQVSDDVETSNFQLLAAGSKGKSKSTSKGKSSSKKSAKGKSKAVSMTIPRAMAPTRDSKARCKKAEKYQQKINTLKRKYNDGVRELRTLKNKLMPMFEKTIARINKLKKKQSQI